MLERSRIVEEWGVVKESQRGVNYFVQREGVML